MRTHHFLFAIVGAGLPFAKVAAADAPAVDTSKWVCKFCPADEGFAFAPDIGVGYVSQDSAKFGEYTGLDSKGAYLLAEGDARYRRKDGAWFDLSAIALGLDSRRLDAAGGRQGAYSLKFRFDELPHALSDSARTPFLGAGSSTLTLPAGWVPGATTQSMSSLDASLHGDRLETQRTLFDLGGTLTRVQHWAFGFDMRHEEKTGTRAGGATFVFNDSRLPMPIDYTTDQLDLSAAYGRERFQARVVYSGSIFRNADEALVWTNPYVPLNGAANGQLALAPDNEFHQVRASAGFKFDERSQLSAELAAGRMTQNAPFLPYTDNPVLLTQPLPRDSLDGRVDVLNGNVRFHLAPIEKLRLNASARYEERDNKTPRALYAGVITDTGFATPRTNVPYGFRRSVLSADASYAFTHGARLSAGCALDDIHRDLQEVARTKDGSCWGKASIAAKALADISLQWKHAERIGSGYQPNPIDAPAQNPLMRLYNLADRDRDEAKLRIDIAPGARFTAGLDGHVTWDSYYASTLGLTSGRSWAAAADCSWSVSEKFSANCYAGRERIETNQANAELLTSAAPWTAATADTIDSAGAAVRFAASEKFDVSLDYTWSRSTGEIDMRNATVGFPDLTTQLNGARLTAKFSPRPKLWLRLVYEYESYHSHDWTLDDVAPATISNVLALGELSPEYDVSVVMLSARYQF